MRTESGTRSSWHDVTAYVLVYILWIITMLVSLQAVLEIRVAVSALWVLGGGNRYAVAVVNQVCLLLVGFIAFVYVIWTERYFRRGVTLRLHPVLSDKVPPLPEGRVMRELAVWGVDLLLRRFALTFAVPLVLYLLSLLAYQGALDLITALH